MKPSAFLIGSILLLGIVAAFPSTAQEQQGAEPKKEYIPTAGREIVLREDLIAIPGKEVHIQRLELPAGWIGGRHYHTGDVFVYVLEGEFVIDVDGGGRKTFRPGEVYHEAVNTVMQASNGSTTAATKLLLFQVGNKGEPLMIQAK